MRDDLRGQIYNQMNLKETDELLEIWKTNDRTEWSDTAFEVIREILQERNGVVPLQNQPITENNSKGDEIENFDFSEAELKIIDDENPPAFYDPFDVIRTEKQIEMAARLMIGLIVIHNLANFSSSFRIVQGYFLNNPNSTAVYLITFVLVAANASIGVLTIYFPLLALARILKILMEMEFNSRRVDP